MSDKPRATTADRTERKKLSIVIPCFNEEKTIHKCVQRVLAIADDHLEIEIIIVDDASTDKSLSIARELSTQHSNIVVCAHQTNQGKGAALRTGFQEGTGDYIAVQDADLEYNPQELKELIIPLVNDEAEVVYGSRFLTSGAHRVLYYWHSMGNKFLTFLSNMFTDLNLTDMETCYKVFKREVIQRIEIEENRFGFEPEITAKIAHMRVRVFEMGISYYGRTYDEGKKISAKDGMRAIYCILRYNAHKAPVPIQFFFYLFIGGTAALVNFATFILLYSAAGVRVEIAAPTAFIVAAFANYFLCLLFIFRHNARWNSTIEIFLFIAVVLMVCLFDYGVTKLLLSMKYYPAIAKLMATGLSLILNFTGRRFIVFPEPPDGPWMPQEKNKCK